ncbi:MAG TPA: monovalent cation/H(+) antiporter subunit G [Terriglobia bacterium]|nr:monovalent cation/H(+) antiporter subunit G [Terriglobia bacterium]
MERFIHILIYAAIVIALFSVLGLLVMEDLNEKLHYLAPPATWSVALITAAIVLEEGASEATVKAILCALILLVTNPVLTHATARAARIREFGHWVSTKKDERRAG